MSVLAPPTSEVKGVAWKASKSRWAVRRYKNGKTEFLGTFKEQSEAEEVSEDWDRKQLLESARASAPRLPVLGKTRLTQYQVEYAMSLAPGIRGF